MKFRASIAAASGIAMAASLSVAAPAQAQQTPFIGQMMLTGANFCPRGYANAEGQLLPIAQNAALFSILGTIYGGDGRTTFALPDLSGREPVGQGNGPGLATQRIGQRGGTEGFTLNVLQLPSHSHSGSIRAFPSNGNSAQPEANYFAITGDGSRFYASSATPPTNFMGANSINIGNSGGNQSVLKRSPYRAMYWCIALQGIFPSRS